ncbi:MAG: response regulator transcription factor [Arcobacteraceae bacterium]|nr:response regulator transcription factor [Arcobacteraceae bacterium]
MKNKILLLEDDMSLSQTLEDFLEDNNFEVVCAYDGKEANEIIYEQNFDLFLLDVNVPYIDGFTLLKEQRENNITTPAIYITSLNSIDSLEEGYKSGGDDYIRKPFELKELLFRIETILKRGYFHNTSQRIEIDKDISFDIDTDLLLVKEEKIQLNTKEIKLLKLFLQNRDVPLSHEKIHDTLWEYDETPSETSLRTYIKVLRKYIGKEKIVSIKKLGYRFN